MRRGVSSERAGRRAVGMLAVAATVGLGVRAGPQALAGTTIVVNSLADTFANDGLVTFREALQAANSDTAGFDAPAGSGHDTIQFAPSLFASGPATLNMAGTEFGITSSVDIQGPGSNSLTLNAQQFS